MNRITDTYLAECTQGDAGRQEKTVRDLLPAIYAESYGALLLPRPMFVDNDEMTAFADDLGDLFRILVSLPERYFDGDIVRYGAALGMDERLGELMRIGATGLPHLYARADAYHDGSAFKILEFNVGSELGGIDAAQLNRAYLRDTAFGDFATRHRLGYLDTAGYLADSLYEAGRTVTSRPPVVALIEGNGGLAEHLHVFVAIREAMAGYGIDLLLGEIGQLTSTRGKLVLDGTAIDVVLRYFAADQLLDQPADRASLELVMRAHADGKTALFTPLEGALFGSKGALGLLHEPQWRHSLSAREIETIDRIVPWTRVVSRTSADLSTADHDALLDECRARRESLILKPGVGYGAVGVVIGRDLTDQAWADALALAEKQDFVAQQLVVPASEPVPNIDTGEWEDWRANWGVFVTGSGYGGAFVRALKARDGSVISYSNPGTRGTCVFTSPGSAAGTTTVTGVAR